MHKIYGQFLASANGFGFDWLSSHVVTLASHFSSVFEFMLNESLWKKVWWIADSLMASSNCDEMDESMMVEYKSVETWMLHKMTY